MLILFCGDAISTSRTAFHTALTSERTHGAVVQERENTDLMESWKKGEMIAQSLFAQKTIYTTINFLSVWKRGYGRNWKKELPTLIQNADFVLYDWEEKSSYDLGIDTKIIPDIREYKASVTTFDLLKTIVPGGGRHFILTLHTLTQTQVIEITFSMIARHALLMRASLGGSDMRDSPFLVNLARGCSKYWDIARLDKFIGGLHRIDLATKTGATPHTLLQSLELLACYTL